jgi:hypothetical protein
MTGRFFRLSRTARMALEWEERIGGGRNMGCGRKIGG